MYLKQNINRPNGNPGRGLKVRAMIDLYDVEDIQYMPPRDENGVVIVENIVMKPGCYAESIYMTSGTVEVTSGAEGDTDQVGFQPQVKFNHPGNTKQIREFKANSVNRRFIIVIRHCDGEPADIIGDLCNPCKLTPSYTGNSESSINEMVFQQIMRGDDIGIYEGTVAEQEPVGTITGNAVAYTADGQYQVAEGATSINSVTGGADGAVITILGLAGSSATVSGSGEGSNIILKGGRAFGASAGAQLTLKAYSVGANELKWIEQSRYSA